MVCWALWVSQPLTTLCSQCEDHSLRWVPVPRDHVVPVTWHIQVTTNQLSLPDNSGVTTAYNNWRPSQHLWIKLSLFEHDIFPGLLPLRMQYTYLTQSCTVKLWAGDNLSCFWVSRSSPIVFSLHIRKHSSAFQQILPFGWQISKIKTTPLTNRHKTQKYVTHSEN